MLVEHIPAVVNISGLDEASSTLYISPQVEQLLGYPQQQWIDEPDLWSRSLHPEDRDRIVRGHLEHLVSGGEWAEEYRLIGRDGRIVWIREHATIVSDEQGKPLFEQGVWLDVTDRKQAEQDLVRSYQALQKTDGERQRLLASLVTAQEQERRRIAGDIHDDALQQLAAMILHVHLASSQSGSVAGDDLADLIANLRKTVESLRHLLFETRPPVLDQGGIATAIRTYLAHVLVESPIRYKVRSELAREPTAEIRTLAYRIMQEAVANIRNHAQASRISVTLLHRDGGMLIRVEDDGKGFTQADVERAGPSHIGLLTMRERAELAGGWLDIQSTPRLGTTVTFWLPLAGDIVQLPEPAEVSTRS